LVIAANDIARQVGRYVAHLDGLSASRAKMSSVELLRKRTIRYSNVGFLGIYTLLERLSWAHCIDSRGWIEKGKRIVRRCE
jgi:hypothetical protein